MANKPQKHIHNLPEEHRDSLVRAIVRHGKVKVVGLGIFEVKRIPARSGRHPQTGEATVIRAYYKVKFRPTKALKEAVAVRRTKRHEALGD